MKRSRDDAFYSNNNLFYRDIHEVGESSKKSCKNSISTRDFKIIKLIGDGSYGKVFLAKKIGGVDNGELYAMKVIEKSKTLNRTRVINERKVSVYNCLFII